MSAAEHEGGTEHHSVHWGVKDVATLVLEDNMGNTYEFYTFQVCGGHVVFYVYTVLGGRHV